MNRRRSRLANAGRAAGFISLLLLASWCEPVFAQGRAPLMYNPEPSTFRVPAPPELKLQQKGLKAQQATITVNYLPPGTDADGDICVAWTTQAQTAFGYAANVWASQLQSPVPITIDACYATNLGAGVLGEAGPYTFLRNFSGNPTANTWYPIAVANALAGSDLDPAHSDITAAFSSTYNWYYGTDGNVPNGQVDFVSVVLHEIGHGLGFTGSADIDSVTGLGSWGEGSGIPFAFDRFTENGAGQSLINVAIFPNPSAALASALKSNSVFFDGANANGGNGGARVPLYAPATWSGGSSYSHLAESFNNTPNALMTYSLSSGESVHSPGPVTLGILKDLGWSLQTTSTADIALTQSVNANPASAGKDAVFTMTVTNNGPGTATGVAVTATYDPTATVIWASPACQQQGTSAAYVCDAATLGNGASSAFRLVLRKGAVGTVSNTATVTAATTDSVPGNNTAVLSVPITALAPGVPVLRYRLYSPVTLEHHFTTDLNEYTVLGALVGTWVQEGTVGKVLNNPGSFNGVPAMPYYRLYNTSTQEHHWTTDANEYYTLVLFPQWQGEGVDGYILPTNTTGATQLYRLLYPFVSGLHHWTIDANEYSVLTTQYGWIGEGGTGFVIQ